MKPKTKSNLFYVFPVFLFISACLWASSGGKATPVPFPGSTPTVEATITSEPTASPSPTIVAGSYEDFRSFAIEIAAALQDKETSFFDKHAAPSTWNCLGDETVGVCKGAPADTTLEGMPVTYDWTSYEFYSKEKYRERWQTTFANHGVVKLAAVAQQLGENPFMPMAEQSSLAVVSVADNKDPASIREVRILLFEYRGNAWYLPGEWIVTGNADAWLKGTCPIPTCYDMWMAWPE